MSNDAERQNPDPIRSLLQAYADGELMDENVRQQIESRLRDDAELQSEFESLRMIREAIRSVPRPPAPSYLRGKVISILDESSARIKPRRRFAKRPIQWIAVAAAALLMIFGVTYWRAAMRPDMTAMLVPFVERHIAQSVSGSAHVELNDRQQIERWLGERLEFSAALPQWPWAEPVSAGIDYVDGKRVACVRFKAGGEDFTLFARLPGMPGMLEEHGAVSPSTAMIDEVRGYRVACWFNDGLDYILVATASSQEIFQDLKGEA